MDRASMRRPFQTSAGPHPYTLLQDTLPSLGPQHRELYVAFNGLQPPPTGPDSWRKEYGDEVDADGVTELIYGDPADA